MKLERGMPVAIGAISGMVYGGPFRQFEKGTRRLTGIKMAVEIKHPHDFKVDTRDYNVPKVEDMQAGVIHALQALSNGSDVYVGCMGGIGRTGLFMGCMAKVMIDYHAQRNTPGYPIGLDPVRHVRHHYKPEGGHIAIETQQQQDYVAAFDTTPALDWMLLYEEASVVVREVEVIKEVRVEVPGPERIVYLTPFDWLMMKLTGRTPA